MELDRNQVEEIIQGKAKKSKVLVSVILGIIVVLSILNSCLTNIELYWFIYFFILELLCMPTLFNCSKDLKGYNANDLLEKEGQILDLFLEDETKTNGNWILILKENGTKGETDYLLKTKPNEDIKVDDYVKVSITKLLRIPTKIEKVENSQDDVIENNNDI